MGKKEPSVADVMTVDATVLGVDSTLEEADFALRSTFIKGVPVVNDRGALVGIITHANLVAYRFAHWLPDADESGPTPSRRGDEAKPPVPLAP